jgi:hypothetical protein
MSDPPFDWSRVALSADLEQIAQTLESAGLLLASGGSIDVVRAAIERSAEACRRLAQGGPPASASMDADVVAIVDRMVAQLPRVRFEPGPAHPARATPVQVGQVIWSLLANALAASADAIEVRVWSDARGVYTRIVDAGPGMSPEVQARAFEPFFSTWNRPGLGLTGVRDVMSAVRGAVQLTSAPGAGCVAQVRWPLAGPPVPTPTSRSAPCHVLLVEAVPEVRASLARQLRQAGHTVQTAPSCSHALQWLATHTPDLILTDTPFESRVPLAVLREGNAYADWPGLQRPFSAAMLLALVAELTDSS